MSFYRVRSFLSQFAHWRALTKSMTFALATYLMLFAASPSVAEDIFVDKNSGSSQGTSTNPFLTLQEALDKAVSNGQSWDTIKVKGYSGHSYLRAKLNRDVRPPGATAAQYNDGIRIEKWGLIKPTISGLNNHVSTTRRGLELIRVDNVTINDCIFDDGFKASVQLFGCKRVYMTNCVFKNAHFRPDEDSGPFAGGHGLCVEDPRTFDIKVTSCVSKDNWASGYEFNSQQTDASSGDRTILRVEVKNSHSFGNGLQGLRTQGVVDFTVTNGFFNDNDGSGIQIEQLSSDIELTGVTCRRNGRRMSQFSNEWPNEKGIWLKDTVGATLTNCICDANPVNIGVSRSEDIDLVVCTMKNATNAGTDPFIRVAGLHIWQADTKASIPTNAPMYTGQPASGARRVKALFCTFDNNNGINSDGHDVIYGLGVSRLPLDSGMSFTDNELVGWVKPNGSTLDVENQKPFPKTVHNPQPSGNYEELDF